MTNDLNEEINNSLNEGENSSTAPEVSAKPTNDFNEEIDNSLNEGENSSITPEVSAKPVQHNRMLSLLIDQIKKVDLIALAELGPKEMLQNKHTQIITVQMVQEMATKNNWALCIHNGFLYSYNSQYWDVLEREVIQTFLGCASEKLGVGKFTARHYAYRKQLVQQFMAQAILPRPEPKGSIVLVNLKNGTFEIGPEGSKLRNFDMRDFLPYQLNFDYNPEAKAPMFMEFINTVQPDIDCQKVLAEFFGSVFIKTETLKLEKALMLYGEGANGKSVFYDLMNALLGETNVSSYSLQSLMDTSGYYRAMLSNKLLNYASEITGELEAGMFKQLTSGEPVPARMIYCAPIIVKDYGKLAFNCNGLPKNVEHTHAYFRRFLIVPFNVTIPDKDQDRELSQKIIAAGELSGIFNWVLEGLNRLLSQKGFTNSDAINKELAKYKADSDNVKVFLEENNYEKAFDRHISVKYLSDEYGEFCKSCRYKPLNHGNFVKRLRALGIEIEKRNTGLVAFVQKSAPEQLEGAPSGTPLASPPSPLDFFEL